MIGFIYTISKKCPSGEMVDAVDSKSSVERRVGSSPTLGTIANLIARQVDLMTKLTQHQYLSKRFH